MKHPWLKRTFITLGLSLAVFSTFHLSPSQLPVVTEALGTSTTTLPSSINVTALSDSQIRSYYSSLDALSTSERQGTNLLKNLKPILSTNIKYYPYTTIIWKIYKITDRDWVQSPLTTTQLSSYYSTYEASDDPFWVLLYRNDNYTATAAKSSDGKGTVIDREHCWPQSRGFKADSGASGPAGTDLHHLMAADSYNNQQGHNNYPWGDESNKNAGTSAVPIGTTAFNQTGTRWVVTNVNNASDFIYEPQDSDKGNVARAIFYMAARYNNWANAIGAISAFEPFLHITNDKYASGSSISSTDSTPATMGILNTLLSWHAADPVDAYEIKRNNLIYRNFQNNRNPFIDFPEWVNAVYGNSGTYATPSSDTINGYNDNAIAVTDFSLSPTSATLYAGGGTQTITPTFTPSNASNKTLNWSSNNTGVATVNSDGVITPVAQGSATITATTTDGSAISKTVSITVNAAIVKVLDYITVSGSPSTAVYRSSFSTSGITVTAHYTDSSTEDVTATATIGSPDTSVLGTQEVTVSQGGKSTTYSIKVTNLNSTITYATDLILSEYVEGSSNNKYLEIYNGTENSIDLTDYKLNLYANGSATATNSNTLSGTLNAGDTKVYANASAALSLPNGVTTTSSTSTNFNGDDAIALYKISTAALIDIFGEIGVDPGTAWTGTGTSTLDKTLVRKSTVTSGRSSNGAFDPSTEWTQYAIDDATHLGSHTMDLGNTFTALEQATAFATYVMFGLGKNAAGQCALVYEDLNNEYGWLVSYSKTEFDSNTSTTISGLNESNQSVTYTFADARARLAYLELFGSNENLMTPTPRASLTGDGWSAMMLLILGGILYAFFGKFILVSKTHERNL